MNATTTAQPRSRSLRPAKEELPSLLEAHDPPISRNKLSQRVGINLAHVSRACSPRHRARFSGEALGRIALLLGLPRDYFPEYRLDYLIRRFGGDGSCATGSTISSR